MGLMISIPSASVNDRVLNQLLGTLTKNMPIRKKHISTPIMSIFGRDSIYRKEEGEILRESGLGHRIGNGDHIGWSYHLVLLHLGNFLS